jgi:multidrug efflux system outer membrane protein
MRQWKPRKQLSRSRDTATLNGICCLRPINNAPIASRKQEKLVAAAQDAIRLARIRYEGGSTAFLEVLTTESNLYTADLNLINAQQIEALSLVQLSSALGGGWQH